MNLSNYFPHNVDARMDEKIVRIRMKHRSTGYAIYFYLLERLAANPLHEEELDYDVLRFDFQEDVEIIRSVVEDFGLFNIEERENGKKYFSQSLKDRLAEVDSKRERLANAGRLGGLARAAALKNAKQIGSDANKESSIGLSDAIAMPEAIVGDVQAIKENKRKEDKIKEKRVKGNVAAAAAPNLSLSKSQVFNSSLDEEQQKCKEREKVFHDKLIPYVEGYGKKMVRAFFDHWSEKTPDGTQMLFELQPTFEIGKRLAKWKAMEKKPTSSGAPTIHKYFQKEVNNLRWPHKPIAMCLDENRVPFYTTEEEAAAAGLKFVHYTTPAEEAHLENEERKPLYINNPIADAIAGSMDYRSQELEQKKAEAAEQQRKQKLAERMAGIK